MKAPTSSEKLRLLLPHPAHAHRVKWLLYGILIAIFVTPLLFVLSYFAIHAAPLVTQRWRWRIIAVVLLLLGSCGYTMLRPRLPDCRVATRQVIRQLISPTGLCVLLAMPAIRLFYLLALETDQPLTELLLANWFLLALLVLLGFLLVFRGTIDTWVDGLFFRQQRRQREDFLALLEQLRSSDNVTEAAQSAIRTLTKLLHPEHIRLLFQDANLCDFHFAIEALNPPSHLPANFPLQNLFGAEHRAQSFPFALDQSFTAAETVWLVDLHAQLLVPMVGSNNRLIGMMVLGMKQSAQPYTQNETYCLQAIAQQIAIISERALLREKLEIASQFRLARLARLEATQNKQRLTNLPIIEENHAQDQLLVQEHLNDLPQRQEVPARVG